VDGCNTQTVHADGVPQHLREMEWEGVDWIHLAQDLDQWQAVMSTVMNLRVL
jgi:hypothetical protein